MQFTSPSHLIDQLQRHYEDRDRAIRMMGLESSKTHRKKETIIHAAGVKCFNNLRLVSKFCGYEQWAESFNGLRFTFQRGVAFHSAQSRRAVLSQGGFVSRCCGWSGLLFSISKA